MTWPHPLIHPTTQPPTHSPMGGGVSTNHKSSKRIKLSWFVQVLSHFNRLGGTPLRWVGWVGVAVDVGWWRNLHNLKSSNRIEISWFVKFLLTFDWFQGSTPPGGWGWVDGSGTLSGCLGVAPHMCACTHAHMCERWCHNGIPQDFLWEQPFAWNYHVYTCMHVHMHACMHVHMCTCMGHLPKHCDRVPSPSTHPHPRGWTLKSVKSQ